MTIHHHDPPRIHTIILTSNRPVVLRRCVNAAVASLDAADLLTVLDDSSNAAFYQNALALAQASLGTRSRIIHLRAAEVHRLVAHASNHEHLSWQQKTAPRDIAPLRNLELLVSLSVAAQTTILVDDDLCSFNLKTTHDIVDSQYADGRGIIVGAQIAGLTEQDTITRVADAMHRLPLKPNGAPIALDALFRVPVSEKDARPSQPRWVSAGYIGFRLPLSRVFAFPPGYNEDWLWCLLHTTIGETPIIATEHTVLHEPPSVRRPTAEDVVFELYGDLVFDCLCARGYQGPRLAACVLESLQGHTPDPSVLPSFRIKQVLDQAAELFESGYRDNLSALDEYGLAVARELFESHSCEIDWTQALRVWCADAVANSPLKYSRTPKTPRKNPLKNEVVCSGFEYFNGLLSMNRLR